MESRAIARSIRSGSWRAATAGIWSRPKATSAARIASRESARPRSWRNRAFDWNRSISPRTGKLRRIASASTCPATTRRSSWRRQSCRGSATAAGECSSKSRKASVFACRCGSMPPKNAKQFALGFGAELEVVEPQELREYVIATARAVVAAYTEPATAPAALAGVSRPSAAPATSVPGTGLRGP